MVGLTSGSVSYYLCQFSVSVRQVRVPLVCARIIWCEGGGHVLIPICADCHHKDANANGPVRRGTHGGPHFIRRENLPAVRLYMGGLKVKRELRLGRGISNNSY